MNWDLTSFFPEFNGKEMKSFKKTVEKEIAEFSEKAGALSPLDAKNAGMWEEIFLKSEEIMARLSHLGSYIGCLAAADAANEEYQKEEAHLALLAASFAKLEIELLRAVKETPDDAFQSFTQRQGLREIEYFLGRMREESHRTMTPEKERLAADLGVDGVTAWGRLYDTMTGKLEFDMEFPDGTKKRLSMSQRRTFLEDPDRRVRRAAFFGGNESWKQVENVCASCLNAISGTRLTLNRHRGIDHFLEVALFQSAIKKETLEAMLEAIYENREIPLRCLKLKAGTFGSEKIAWYDLGAPLDIATRERFSWEKGHTMVIDSFSRAYPALGSFAKEEIEKKWIDWEPRAGKRPGGFCTSSMVNRESRIFMTFHGSMGDVRTLAHETGHAFHSHVMRDLRPFSHLYPMTLAETASTFGEMILTEGLLQDPEISDELKCFILDQDLGNASVYLMDIPVRYEFEKKIYEERAGGEISVSRLKEIMKETQRKIFGDVLEQGGEDPFFWASKLHFYITGVTFYNFPYTFGFLLSRGLFAMFQKEGSDFLPRYEKFLKLTGNATCEDVARESIGRDLTKPEFWAEAIRSLEAPLRKLETLLPEMELNQRE